MARTKEEVVIDEVEEDLEVLLESEHLEFALSLLDESSPRGGASNTAAYPCKVCACVVYLEGGDNGVTGNFIARCEVCVRAKEESIRSKNGDASETRVAELLAKAQGKDKHFWSRRLCERCRCWARYSKKVARCKCDEAPIENDVERRVREYGGAPKKNRCRGPRSSPKKPALASCSPDRVSTQDDHVVLDLLVAGKIDPLNPDFAKLVVEVDDHRVVCATTYRHNGAFRATFNPKALHLPASTARLELRFPDRTTVLALDHAFLLT
mmetsp:Transcript_24359/g.76119  ORF Transcript_24359/g.76119 Transcript_24359/m.76119 type:complete len:267 (-) Transcript_24359:230-1030(-)